MGCPLLFARPARRTCFARGTHRLTGTLGAPQRAAAKAPGKCRRQNVNRYPCAKCNDTRRVVIRNSTYDRAQRAPSGASQHLRNKQFGMGARPLHLPAAAAAARITHSASRYCDGAGVALSAQPCSGTTTILNLLLRFYFAGCNLYRYLIDTADINGTSCGP
jgi:hypothetical protein